MTPAAAGYVTVIAAPLTPYMIFVLCDGFSCHVEALQCSGRGVQVLLDGIDIRSLPLEWLRKQIGLVSQVNCSQSPQAT